MDPLQMAFADDVPTELFPDGLPGPGPDPNSPVQVHDYDFSEVGDYSDLDYTELRATLGFNYKLGAAASVFAAVTAFDLDDGQPYIQNATGSVSLITGGLTWNF